MAVGERAEPAAVTIISQTGPSADLDSLPSWESVFRGMKSPGCVVHLRQVTGKYSTEEYTLRYSSDAKAGAEAWRALTYNVMVAVTRPTEGGEKEVLPQRVGIRAVCAMPKSELGTGEAKARVEAILEEKGIIIPGKVEARGPISERLRWALDWLAPRPLHAQQGHRCSPFPPPEDCEIEPIDVTVTVPVTCPAGFDYEATTNSCVDHSTGGTSPGEGSSGGGGSNPGSGGGGTPPPSEPACTDDQRDIASEYEADGFSPNQWPCTVFTHSVTTAGGNRSANVGTHGHVTGYLTEDFLNGRGAVLGAVTGAWIESDWRCPPGNTAARSTSTKKPHVHGKAGDFDAPGFNPGDEQRQRETHTAFQNAAYNSAGATWTSGFEDGCSEGYCRDTYIHVQW